ncbi:MAG TPA: glycosyltransferase [Candidatus Bathyarchaeia archaeon]|nr:glycosyltransferase [Candidatus Bathyarchaeia archaeon]
MIISIILPLSRQESKVKIKRCLDSLAHQNYINFEVIIVTFPDFAKKNACIFKKYPFVKIITGNWNKSVARNLGAQEAKGKYLFHLDADLRLEKNFLAKLVNFLHHPVDSLIIPEVFPKPKTLIQKARFLEKRLLKNTVLESPRVIKKSLFRKIGGFDPNANPLDDWDLRLSLEKEKIKITFFPYPIKSFQSSSVFLTWKRYFQRGRVYSYLKRKYQQINQTKLSFRLKLLTKNINLLLAFPSASLLLFSLKPFDLVFFNLGRFFPYQRTASYASFHQAHFYETQRLTKNYDLYKDYAETKALLALLNPCLKTLEIGAGTGRITQKLTEHGFKIIPTEPSLAMLHEYQKKKNLPLGIKAKAEKLPFPSKSFPQTFSLRVIWHIKNNNLAIKEMARVTQKSLVFDSGNPNRFHRIFSPQLLKDTYPLSLEKLNKILEKNKFKLIKKLPLEVTIPIWLNLLPKKFAEKCFSFLYRLDLTLAKIISPGRWLVKAENAKIKL